MQISCSIIPNISLNSYKSMPIRRNENKFGYKENNDIHFTSTYAEGEIRARQTLSKQRRDDIKELNYSEYSDIMTDLLNNRSDLNSRYIQNNYFIDKSYCENIPFEFMGVIPYCGYEDCNKHINNFISGEEKLSTAENELNNARFISALNYSLSKIDEKYGKYEGFVYRKGLFLPIVPRYYSTSENVPAGDYIYSNLENDLRIKQELNFNIIKVKNGHKLNSMLYEYATSGLKELAEEEDEILIDTNSKFRLIRENEYTDEIEELKQNYYDIITKDLKSNHSSEELKQRIKINVWQEV